MASPVRATAGSGRGVGPIRRSARVGWRSRGPSPAGAPSRRHRGGRSSNQSRTVCTAASPNAPSRSAAATITRERPEVPHAGSDFRVVRRLATPSRYLFGRSANPTRSGDDPCGQEPAVRYVKQPSGPRYSDTPARSSTPPRQPTAARDCQRSRTRRLGLPPRYPNTPAGPVRGPVRHPRTRLAANLPPRRRRGARRGVVGRMSPATRRRRAHFCKRRIASAVVAVELPAVCETGGVGCGPSLGRFPVTVPRSPRPRRGWEGFRPGCLGGWERRA
jgi:hypothetical protein